MIQVHELVKTYGSQTLFDRASFSMNAGERIGLVGRNGHGKTTLFRMILGREHPDSGAINVPKGYVIGHLSQHIRFTCPSVLQEACLSLPAADHDRDQTYKAEAIIMGLGFTAAEFDTDPEDLSGGFQVRLNLAKVLVSDPNLLLLDEPTNYLDIISMRWLGNFLRAWKKELIIITHDRSFMDSVTTHTMAIHRSKIRKVEGATEKVYQQLLLEEEVYEKTRINDEKKRKEVEQFINRFRAKATKARAVQSRIKSLQRQGQLEELSEIRNLDFTFNAAPFTGRHLLEVRDLRFGYDLEEPPLVKNLSFHVGKRDRIALIGRNGKGKTTLLNLLAGELTPQSGSISRHGNLKFSYFGQTNILRLDPDNTIEEEVMDAHPDHNRGVARGICGVMMFPGDLALKKVSVLSGGERSRVLLGKLLLSPANLLLLDEPTNHLDMESAESLVEAVDAFSGSVIFVTHSEMILDALATRLIVFDGGTVTLFEGTYRDFLNRKGWAEENELLEQESRTEDDALPSRNRKQLKRLRAELINEKSRTLGALNVKIADLEQTIIELEERADRENNELLEASTAGNGERIKALSKSIHTVRARIDSCFSQLEALHHERDAKMREFEERLLALQEP